MKVCGFCNGSIILILSLFLQIYHDFFKMKQHLLDILFFTCLGIDNCFYAFSNTQNTPKFEPFHIAHQPPQIR